MSLSSQASRPFRPFHSFDTRSAISIEKSVYVTSFCDTLISDREYQERRLCLEKNSAVVTDYKIGNKGLVRNKAVNCKPWQGSTEQELDDEELRS